VRSTQQHNLLTRQHSLLRAITNGTVAIQRLQKTAEIGFFLFLFPYYLSHVLIDLAKNYRFHGPGIEKWIILCSIFSGGAIVGYNWLIEQIETRTYREMTRTGRIAIALLLFVVVLLASTFLSQVFAHHEGAEEGLSIFQDKSIL
jgi:hypothetical protein